MWRELLPHVFTIACRSFSEGEPLLKLRRRQLFSVALAVSAPPGGTFLLGSMVLCAAPTFLYPTWRIAIERTAAAKLHIILTTIPAVNLFISSVIHQKNILTTTS
jgi:hypothetical protein